MRLHVDRTLAAADWPKRTPDRYEDLTGKDTAERHTPGGHDHDQKTHGRRPNAGKTGGGETEAARDKRIAERDAAKARESLKNARERFSTIPDVAFFPAEPGDWAAAQEGMKRNAYVTAYTAEELQEVLADGGRLVLSEDGKSGYLLRGDGYLSGVFNNGGPKGQGVSALVHAIENGAETLDAFDHFLPRLYHAFGFREYNRMSFADEYAPANWDYDKLGRPDVVEMRYRVDAPRARDEIMSNVGGYGTYSMDEQRDDKRDTDKRGAEAGLSDAGRMAHRLPPRPADGEFEYDSAEDAFEAML